MSHPSAQASQGLGMAPAEGGWENWFELQVQYSSLAPRWRQTFSFFTTDSRQTYWPNGINSWDESIKHLSNLCSSGQWPDTFWALELRPLPRSWGKPTPPLCKDGVAGMASESFLFYSGYCTVEDPWILQSLQGEKRPDGVCSGNQISQTASPPNDSQVCDLIPGYPKALYLSSKEPTIWILLDVQDSSTKLIIKIALIQVRGNTS